MEKNRARVCIWFFSNPVQFSGLKNQPLKIFLQVRKSTILQTVRLAFMNILSLCFQNILIVVWCSCQTHSTKVLEIFIVIRGSPPQKFNFWSLRTVAMKQHLPRRSILLFLIHFRLFPRLEIIQVLFKNFFVF